MTLPCPAGARGAAGVRIRRCLPLRGKSAAEGRTGSRLVTGKSFLVKRFTHQETFPARRGTELRGTAHRLCISRRIFGARHTVETGFSPFATFSCPQKANFPPSPPRLLPQTIPRGERRALPAPAQGSKVDCQASATVSKKTSKGVRQLRRLRGLWLIRSRTRSNSACDTSRKLQPRGKKYRSSPLAFSLQPLCHGLCGSAKYTGALSCSSNSRNSANSDPLSSDKLFIGLSFSASTIAFLVSPACLE